MKSPFEWLAKAIQNRPFHVTAIALAVLVLILYGMTLLAMETGNDTYIDKTTLRGSLLNHYSDVYESDNIMIIFESDEVLTTTMLEYIDRLEEDIRNEQYISGVNSIADLFNEANHGDLPQSQAEINFLKEQLPSSLLDRYVPSNLMTIIIVELEPGVSEDVQKQVLNNLDSMIRISDNPPGTSITVSGSPAFDEERRQQMGASLGTLILAAMLLMVLAMLLLFSHVRYRLLPVFVVGTGLIMTFGIMGLLGINISMVVIGAFPVLIGIGIDYAIQFHSRIDEVVRHSSLKQAVQVAVKSAAPSLLIAMSATSIGFIAMVFSPLPMMVDFGICCMIGVLCCYISALIIIPTFAVISKYKPKKEGIKKRDKSTPGNQENGNVNRSRSEISLIERYNHMLGQLAYKIAKNPIPVILSLFFIAAFGLYLDNQVPINTDEESFVPQDMPALIDMKKITRVWGSTDTIPIIITADNVLNPEILKWMYNFENSELKNNYRITSISSLTTILIEYNNGILPETDSEIKSTLNKIPDSIKKQFLNGHAEAIIQFSTEDMSSEISQSTIAALSKDLEWHLINAPPGVSGHITGSADMFAALMGDVKESKTEMTILGFVMILAFLLIIYRKINSISPLIPIIMIVGWNGAIMYLLGLDYSPLTAVLGSMTIGVASEYTILIMERCEEELKNGMNIYEAIQMSVQKIGTSITVSGLTTVFGFSALIISPFVIISNFGIVTVITVAFSLLGSIIVMPAVLVLMHRFTRPNGHSQIKGGITM